MLLKDLGASLKNLVTLNDEPEALLLGGATQADLELVQQACSDNVYTKRLSEKIEVCWRTKFTKDPSLMNVLARRTAFVVYGTATLGISAAASLRWRHNAMYLAEHSVYALTKTHMIQLFDGDPACFKKTPLASWKAADFGGKLVFTPKERNEMSVMSRKDAKRVRYNDTYLVCDVGKGPIGLGTIGGRNDEPGMEKENCKVAFKFDAKSDTEKLAAALERPAPSEGTMVISDPFASKRKGGLWW
jgi:hypothetical protein